MTWAPRDRSCWRDANARRGLSILELLGCVAALAGGVIAGSIYLGVDVVGLLSRLAEQSQRPAAVATPAPAAAAPITAPGASELSSTPATASPLPVESLPGSPASPIAAPAAPAVAEPRATSALIDAITLTPEQEDTLTKAYWNALNECMRAEVAHRTAGLQKTGNWELYDYLSGRSEGHQTAATEIAKLSRHGVDPHVLDFAYKVQAWHEEGAKLYSRARDLLTDAPTAQLSGPFAQSWQSAATQHQMEERLLAEKLQAVQSYLDHGDRAASAATPTAP